MTDNQPPASNGLREELAALRKSIDAIRDQKERQYQEQQTQRKLPQPPLGVEAEIYEKPDANRENEAKTHRNSTLRAQWITAIATCAAFIAAAIYAGIAARQLGQMREATRQATIAADAAKNGADAAKRSADTGAQSLEDVKKQFRMDQRPYIALPAQFSTGALGIHEGRVRILMPLQNYGKSPALGATYYARIAIGEERIKHINFNLPTDRDIGIVPPGNLPPIAVFSDPLEKTEDAKKPMVIYGQIDYTDMFPPPKPHYILVFCQRANVEITLAVGIEERKCINHNYIK
ncbi:MAG: hypothetical protein M3O09_06395 [Acidobacteriota bacterium]|nr:hypothetical protein [Acidobacteriota bacterium]